MVGAFAGGGISGRGETEFEGLLHDLPNSLVVGLRAMFWETWTLAELLHDVERKCS